MNGSRRRFTVLQRLLHWLMAVCILAMLFIGVGMVSTLMPKYVTLVAIHKPLGIAILLLALIRYKDTDSRFLLLMGCIPQRYFYDALLLWLIPATTLELLVTTVASWGAWAFIPPTKTIHQVALLSVIFNYLPMLAVVLSRPWRKGRWR